MVPAEAGHAPTVAVTLDTGVPAVGVVSGHLFNLKVEESINTQAHYQKRTRC